VSFRSRLRRLEKEAQGNGIRLRLQDGTVRVFEALEIQKDMYLTKMDVFMGGLRESPVLDAVRRATPESRASFEQRFGPISRTQYVVAPESRGGWVESYTLTEEGVVERIRYEGGSEEARRVREGCRSGLSDEDISLPRPPVAGRWVDEPDEDLSEP
jgi:hypothetical protein